MWYYVTLNTIGIGAFKSVEKVNHYLAQNGYSVINVYQASENEIYVEVERW